MGVISKGPSKYCLSSDSLPMDEQPGTRIQYLDTGEGFIFDGEVWTEDLSLIFALRAAMIA
jgi:hypothetical protein